MRRPRHLCVRSTCAATRLGLPRYIGQRQQVVQADAFRETVPWKASFWLAGLTVLRLGVGSTPFTRGQSAAHDQFPLLRHRTFGQVPAQTERATRDRELGDEDLELDPATPKM